MELGEVSGIQGLVPEDSVNRKEFHWLEAAWLVGDLVQHLRTDGGRMRAKDVLLCFLKAPAWTIPEGTFKTIFMDVLYALDVVFGQLET
jgi:hypothetical protein